MVNQFVGNVIECEFRDNWMNVLEVRIPFQKFRNEWCTFTPNYGIFHLKLLNDNYTERMLWQNVCYIYIYIERERERERWVQVTPF